MRRLRLVWLATLTGLAAGAEAQEDEPDLGFLEYLGSWQESDEEWLIVAGIDEDLGEDLDDHGEASDEDDVRLEEDVRLEDEPTDESDETDHK